MSAGKPGATGAEIGITAWTAPNPFGEVSPYLLLHPRDDTSVRRLPEIAADVGMLPASRSSDIPRIGTDHLYLVLSPHRFALRSQEAVLIEHIVSDDWLAAARERRYVVLAIGIDPIQDEESRGEVMDYLAHRERIFAGLVSEI